MGTHWGTSLFDLAFC